MVHGLVVHLFSPSPSLFRVWVCRLTLTWLRCRPSRSSVSAPRRSSGATRRSRRCCTWETSASRPTAKARRCVLPAVYCLWDVLLCVVLDRKVVRRSSVAARGRRVDGRAVARLTAMVGRFFRHPLTVYYIQKRWLMNHAVQIRKIETKFRYVCVCVCHIVRKISPCYVGRAACCLVAGGPGRRASASLGGEVPSRGPGGIGSGTHHQGHQH